MKKYILITGCIIIAMIRSEAQSYNMQNAVISTCSGTLYDSGGPSANYSNNEHYQMTICSNGTPQQLITITFSSWAVSPGDELIIYEGSGTTGMVLVNTTTTDPVQWGPFQVGGWVAQAGDNCITLVFNSNSSTNSNGWVATFSCINSNNQNFTLDINTNVPQQNDTISLCQNAPAINFSAFSSYPNNNIYYHQSDSTTIFNWDFGDGTSATGAMATHTFAGEQGYIVTLTATDVNNHTNSNHCVVYIRISRTPVFAGHSGISPTVICQGDPVTLQGGAFATPWTMPFPNNVAGTTYLPDGSGGSYSTSITHTLFGANQVFTGAADIESVCLNMEHSYTGDLTITLTCPNGQSIDLLLFPNGCSNNFLGEPIDNDNITGPGVGYTYCWTPSAVNTITQVANQNQYTYTDLSGTTYTNHYYIPAGDYLPVDPDGFNGLAGCPLNGNWTITVIDNLNSDNGYIFWWGLNFSPDIIPQSVWGYQNTFSATGTTWSYQTGGSWINPPNNGNATGTYFNVSPGLHPFQLHVTDNFGCSYDTTYLVQVLPLNAPNCCITPSPNAGPDDVTCNNFYNPHAAGWSYPGNTGNWTVIPSAGITIINGTSLSPTILVTNSGIYSLIWTEINNGCSNADTLIVQFIQAPDANAGTDNQVCGSVYTLNAGTLFPGMTGLWSCDNPLVSINTPSNPVTTVDVSGVGYNTYNFNWTINNEICTDNDDVRITFLENPHPEAGPDQTVCGNVVQLSGTPSDTIMSGYWTGPTNTLYNPSNNQSNVTANIPPFYTTQTATFWWHQNNGFCTDSDQVSITFTPYAGPNQVSAGYNLYTCDSIIQLHGIIQGITGTGSWSSVQAINIESSVNANTNVWIHPNSTNYNNNSQFVVYMMWTVTQGTCSARDTMTITFYQMPHADAGTDEAMCGLTYQFDGNTSIAASAGMWSLLSAPTGGTNPSYSNIYDPKSHIQVSQYGIYSFQWRERNLYNNMCSSTDTVHIEFVERPTISAGVDQWVCGDTTFLNAIPSTNSDGGTWLTAPVNWLPNNSAIINPNAQIVHESGGNSTVPFVWQEFNQATINNLQCVSQDSMWVNFFVNHPSVEFIDSQWDTVQCGRTYNGLNAQAPPEGFGYWVDANGPTEIFPSPYSLNATCTVGNFGLHHFYWVVKNGLRPNGTSVCIDSSEVNPIRFIEIPVANASANLWAINPDAGSEIKWDTACGLTYYLQPIITGPGIGQWQTSGYPNRGFTMSNTGTSANPNDSAFSVIYNTGNTYFEFFWQMDNSTLPYSPYSHGCIDRDTLRITFAKIPSGNIEFRMPYCYGQTALVYPEFDNEGNPDHFSWSFDGGTIDSTKENISTPTIQNDSLFYISWDTTDGKMYHPVSLIAENSYGCMSPNTTDTIWEPAPVYPIDSIYPATCMQPNGIIKLFPEGSSAYIWMNQPDSGSIALEYENLMYGIPYYIRHQYSSWASNQTCTEIITITIPNTGNLTAQFTVLGDTVHLIPGQSDIFFDNTTFNGKNWEWHFGDGTTSSAENPDHIYNSGGVYYVYLIAKSKEGCESMSDSIPVEIERNSEIIIPNIFTPNGDNKNDYFQVSAKTIKNFQGIITNQWGKKLYEWSEWNKNIFPASGWDGKINGNDASPGVYYYIIKAEGWDNINYLLKGAFHLEREK